VVSEQLVSRSIRCSGRILVSLLGQHRAVSFGSTSAQLCCIVQFHLGWFFLRLDLQIHRMVRRGLSSPGSTRFRPSDLQHGPSSATLPRPTEFLSWSDPPIRSFWRCPVYCLWRFVFPLQLDSLRCVRHDRLDRQHHPAVPICASWSICVVSYVREAATQPSNILGNPAADQYGQRGSSTEEKDLVCYFFTWRLSGTSSSDFLLSLIATSM
jgi:hypothetical protein